VVEVSPIDDYRRGEEYIVDVVDPSDGTFRARDPGSGRVGGWLRWTQVESADDTIGLDFLKQHLSPEALTLLSAFDGLAGLRLKSEIRDRILLALPDLEERVREAARERRRAGPRVKKRKLVPAPHRSAAESVAGATNDPPLDFVEVDDDADGQPPVGSA